MECVQETDGDVVFVAFPSSVVADVTVNSDDRVDSLVLSLDVTMFLLLLVRT